MSATILEHIVKSVREDLVRRKAVIPMASLVRACETADLSPTRGFRRALMGDAIHIIAEIKKGSPSQGIFTFTRPPHQQGLEYERAGATCVSVVTETQFFHGSLEMLADLRRHLQVPLLRKDFIVDPYQIYEARLAGADAILLITAILEDEQLKELYALADKLTLDVLVEVANAQEIFRALGAGAEMIGVNNRHLHDFSIDLDRSLQLACYFPREVTAVSESGINSHEQIAVLRAVGYRGFLVGEYLMRQEDPGRALRGLLAPPRKTDAEEFTVTPRNSGTES